MTHGREDEKVADVRVDRSMSNVANKVLTLYGPDDLRLEDAPYPEPCREEEVLLKLNYVGLCGTDIHLWEEARLSELWVCKRPMIVGHEASATVVETGSRVTHLQVGDRVTMEPAIPCDTIDCQTCKSGNYNHCDEANLIIAGLPGHEGRDAGFICNFMKRPAAGVFRLPHNVSSEIGAMIEPLAIAVHAVKRSQMKVADNVLICGAGPMGCLTAQVAKAFGAGRVLITDMKPDRLEFSREIGVDGSLLIERSASQQENAAKVVEFFGGQGPDVTIECTGAGPATQLAIIASRNGGKIVLVGCGPDLVSVPLTVACLKEIDILGLCRYRNTFPLAIKLVQDGRLPHLSKMITHRIRLENWLTAFKTMKAGCDEETRQMAVKVLIDFN